MVWINHDSAVLALLRSVGPAVATGPLSVTLGALELTKHAFFALIGSFLQSKIDTVHIKGYVRRAAYVCLRGCLATWSSVLAVIM